MNRAFPLILLAFATAAFLAADPVPAKKTKPTSSSAVKTAHKNTKTTSLHTPTTATRAKSGSASNTRTVKYVRARNGKLVRVVSHSSPQPSYQLHPDPERYQKIQQALADRGYFKGEVNGQWGDDSEDALRRFQADKQLYDDDGHITALTLIGLGLGPKHDHDLNTSPLSAPPAAAPNTTGLGAPATAVATPTVAPTQSPIPASVTKPQTPPGSDSANRP